MTSLFLLMVFQYFLIDDKTYACSSSGYPLTIRRTARKVEGKGETIVEKEFLLKVRNSHIIETYKDSDAYRYLLRKFNRLTMPDVAGLGRMLAHVFNIPMPREVYRRMMTTMYWFIENWNTIYDILQRHVVIGVHSVLGKITFDKPEIFNPQPVVVPTKNTRSSNIIFPVVIINPYAQ